MIDIEQLLAETAEEPPCGPNLEYDAAFLELEKSIQGKPEQQFGETVIPAEEPAWGEVQELALSLLQRSKDLRIAIPLTRALVNVEGAAGLNAGLKWVMQKGPASIHSQEMGLAEILRDGLKDIQGVTLYCQDDLRDHIAVLLFNIDGLEAADTGTMLDVDYSIACRTGLHCAPRVHEQLGTDQIHGAVRFGIGPFNTEEHIQEAVRAVGEIAAERRKK